MSAQLIGDSLRIIAASGVVCLTGVGHGGQIPKIATAGEIASTAVLKNNVVIGSVNANKRHWYKAAEALARADRSWLERLITTTGEPGDLHSGSGPKAGRHQGRHSVCRGVRKGQMIQRHRWPPFLSELGEKALIALIGLLLVIVMIATSRPMRMLISRGRGVRGE